MNRRQFLAGMAASPLLLNSLDTAAAESPILQSWKKANIKTDRLAVIEFFSFSCSYCKQLDSSFTQWGGTLPKAIRFEKMPACLSWNDNVAAYAFYAAKYMNKNLFPRYLELCYELIQGRSFEPASAKTYHEAARLAGYDVGAFERALFVPELQVFVKRAFEATRGYQIEFTPSIAIDGQYVIHSGVTSGDYEQLFQVANGLISRVLEGGKL